jgi:hypothetical protein
MVQKVQRNIAGLRHGHGWHGARFRQKHIILEEAVRFHTFAPLEEAIGLHTFAPLEEAIGLHTFAPLEARLGSEKGSRGFKPTAAPTLLQPPYLYLGT